MVARYAVMGNPIAHSLSPIIHEYFSKQTGCSLTYEKIKIDDARFEEQVIDFFSQGGKGLNITSPGKERAYLMSERQSARCVKAKSSNMLWMNEGALYADNTDGVGLLKDLQRYVSLLNKSVLILGSGGACRGIVGPLLAASAATVTIATRSALQSEFPDVSLMTFDALDAHLKKSAYDVVINATSAALSGKPLTLPDGLIRQASFCYDLAYDLSKPTRFVDDARQRGTPAADGLGMLVEQAAEAFFIWQGVKPETLPVIEAFSAQRSSLK